MADPRALLRAFASIAGAEERARIKRSLRIVKAAKRAGLSLRSVVIEDVRLEFEEPVPAAKPARDNEVEVWIKKQQQRHAH